MQNLIALSELYAKNLYLDYLEFAKFSDGTLLFRIAEFNGGVQFFCFTQETPFLPKFSPKNQFCQNFIINVGT